MGFWREKKRGEVVGCSVKEEGEKEEEDEEVEVYRK